MKSLQKKLEKQRKKTLKARYFLYLKNTELFEAKMKIGRLEDAKIN